MFRKISSIIDILFSLIIAFLLSCLIFVLLINCFCAVGYDMSAVYELKLRKLKANNRALAKALADQKLETQQWLVGMVFFLSLIKLS